MAILSLVNSRIGTRTANKSYKLALAQDERTSLSIDAYLSDAWSITGYDDVRHVLLSVVFTNKAAAANSIVRAELSISVRDAKSLQDYSIVELRLPSSPSDEVVELGPSGSYLDVPLALGPREAVGGLIPFVVTASFMGGRSIERLTLVAQDALGAEVRLHDIYPREVKGVPEKEAKED
ncbi:hypothetical protein [Actinomycetospora succinea]|uniref:hypothetical protein n=1 Tax=Actinomycetospora succinea TaxID=663603 RepID=UPI00105D787B|nr:hypothetical protein [Actinomycetospora succinea]